LHGRQQKRHENTDDRNNHQKLDQRESVAFHCGARGLNGAQLTAAVAVAAQIV
jgi:hypothetical protein